MMGKKRAWTNQLKRSRSKLRSRKTAALQDTIAGASGASGTGESVSQKLRTKVGSIAYIKGKAVVHVAFAGIGRDVPQDRVPTLTRYAGRFKLRTHTKLD